YVTFCGERSGTSAPGAAGRSGPVALAFVRNPASTELWGRKLAVSFHVAGESGPMTWHAKALQTSYLTLPGAASRGHDESESAFPVSTTAWYFLDALAMQVPAGGSAVVA